MAGKAMHKSIYIPPELGAKLEAHKEAGYDINFSRVCRTAIEKALDETDEDGVNVGTVLRELRQQEEEIRQLKAVLQGLVRHAAGYCGMTVLSEKDEAAFKDVFENGVESFIYQTKKSAVEEHKKAQQRKRKRKKCKKPTKRSAGKAARLTVEVNETIETRPATLHTGEARVETIDLPPPPKEKPVTLQPLCAICNERNGDVPCEAEDCSNTICWYCWGELDDSSQPKLCTSCQKKQQ